MPKQQSLNEVLDREFLEIRCRLIDIAAAIDRIDRTAGTNGDDQRSETRLAQLQSGVDALSDRRPDRAIRMQQIFSDPYDPKWRKE